jgi:hypothetical protein
VSLTYPPLGGRFVFCAIAYLLSQRAQEPDGVV